MDELSVVTWRIPRSDAAILERATLPEAERASLLRRLRDATGARELVYVPTCQRVAVTLLHAPADAPERVRAAYSDLLGRELPEPEAFRGREAFHHLCESASSLDSLVVGEPQVLGQFKDSLQRSEEAGLCEGGMRHVFGLVFRAAKAVRSETDLFRGKVSLIPLTERILDEHLADKPEPRAVILGTGQIGRRMAELLRAKRPGIALHLVSRDAARAREVASTLDATSEGLAEHLARAPEPADVVALAMVAEAPILDAERLRAQARGRDALVLDLALPRNAEAPAEPVPGLRLVQLDELAQMSAERQAERAREVAPARRVLDRELRRIEVAYAERKLARDLHELSRRFAEVQEERWADAPEGLSRDDPAYRKWYEQMVRALLHEATAAVRKAGCEGREP